MAILNTRKTLVPLCDLKAQYLSIKDEIDSAIARVLSKGNYVMGEEVEAFEEEWAKYCKAKYCVGVASGTDAIYLTLKALLPRGGSVLTTPFTFFATVQAIIQAGSKPVFMDVARHGNINLGQPVLKAHDIALPVHLYGRPAYVPSSYPIPTVEDSAQAHGIPLTGKAMCSSFYPTKNVGAMGQAGAMITDDEQLAREVRRLRTYGEQERFVHYALTGNHRMDELQAAILRVKLPHLDEWNRRRREIALCYSKSFDQDYPTLYTPWDDPNHVYHIYALRCKERDNLAAYLKEHNIETAVRYPVPMHLQPALKYLGYKEGDFPNAEAWANENLSLPIFPEMTSEQVEYVVRKVKDWLRCVLLQ